MVDDSLTPDLRRFIHAAIPSVPHLEALLLTRERVDGWTGSELAARLYLDEARAAALAEDLAHAGLVRVEAGRVVFAPHDDDLRDQVEQLARAYARHVVLISELIHSTTGRKAQQFADAFRLRKDPP